METNKIIYNEQVDFRKGQSMFDNCQVFFLSSTYESSTTKHLNVATTNLSAYFDSIEVGY